ncbi:MAG: replicative DNA helicase, partial [Synechococcus sp. SB0672_bin_10]|nr:replicative DNA helicase [Synechococcus sp. SB0672_bin_10]
MVTAPANPPQPRDPSTLWPSGDAAPKGGNPFSALPNQVPPQNLEAEEAVLGGILLDPEAMARVADILHPDAFYVAA